MAPIISMWANSSVPMSVRQPATLRSVMVYRWFRYRIDAPNSPLGPPSWLMISWAALGSGLQIFTGYSSLLS